MFQLEKGLHSKEDPVQPKIINKKKRQLYSHFHCGIVHHRQDRENGEFREFRIIVRRVVEGIEREL